MRNIAAQWCVIRVRLFNHSARTLMHHKQCIHDKVLERKDDSDRTERDRIYDKILREGIPENLLEKVNYPYTPFGT